MKTRVLCILICAISVILGWQIIALAVPAGSGFTYNGRLEQNNNPPTGFYDFEFALFNDPNGILGSQVSETLFIDRLKVHKGSFNARLDFGENAFDGDARWLLIAVREYNENFPNAFEELLPLVQLTPAPYALSARKIGGKKLADLVQKNDPNSVNASMITKGSITKEKIGNGAVSREKLENGAVNSSKIENKAVGQGQLGDKAVGKGQLGDKAVGKGQLGDKAVGKGQLDDAAVDPNKLEDGAVTTAKLADAAVTTTKLGDISGYELESNYDGFLISLINSGTNNGSGLNVHSQGAIAIKGTSGGTESEGFGVYAENTADGTGVYGYSAGGRGLWGKSDGTANEGYGVYGESTNDGTGVYGYSEEGNGLWGKSGGTAGEGYGVYGENTGIPGGTGIYGYAVHGKGIWGKSDGGVSNGFGVYGENTSNGVGVYGYNSGGGWAARFDGKTAVTGKLYVSDTGNAGTPQEALQVNGQIYVEAMNTGSGNLVYMKGDGRLVQQSSSARYKENIQPLADDFDKILRAESKSFVRKGTGEREIGFIAEEFDALGLNNLVIYKDGKPDGVRYEMVPLYLLETAKDMAETTDQLKNENELLKQQIQSLQEAIEDIKSSMAREVK